MSKKTPEQIYQEAKDIKAKITKKIKAREDKKRQEEEQKEFLLSQYKRRDINGVFLIDGNYAFLHGLSKHHQEISKLEDYIKNFSYENEKNKIEDDYQKHSNSKSAKEVRDIFLEDLEGQPQSSIKRLDELKKFHGENIAQYFTKYAWAFSSIMLGIILDKLQIKQKKIIHPEALFHTEPKPKIADTIISVEKIQSYIFDADLPDFNVQCKKFISQFKDRAKQVENIKNRWGITNEVKRIESECKILMERLQLLAEGRWEFFAGDNSGYIKAPYFAKKSYLDYLSANYPIDMNEKTSVKQGVKYVNLNQKYLNISENEKQVDVKLTIQGCECANDPDIDYVCLITNDGDYVPLIQLLKAKNKEVFLISLNNKPAIALSNELGKDRIFCPDQIDKWTDWEIEERYSAYMFKADEKSYYENFDWDDYYNFQASLKKED